MHFIAILNRNGGTLRTMNLPAFCAEAKSVFEAHGHTIDCEIVTGRQLQRRMRRAAATPGVDAMIAGGGDGTISSAAGIAYETGMTLAVLPAGTMNLFARALKMPMSLSEALAAIAGGEMGAVDIATANGRPFVHQFGVGIHARLVRIRENMTYKSRIGKMAASLRSVAAAAMNPPVFEAELHTRGKAERQSVSGIAVSNNPLGDGHIPHADTLDAGVLGIYTAAPVSTAALIKLAAEVMMGKWRESDAVTEIKVKEVTLTFPRHKRGLRAVLDGELIRLDREVRLKVHPKALKMVLPKVVLDASVTELTL